MKKLLLALLLLCCLSACSGLSASGDPFSGLPTSCTDQGPVNQAGMNEPVSLVTGLMPATSLGEDHTDLQATVDTTAAILAQTLLCHGRYAVLVEDKTFHCLKPTWKYAPPFSWNDFAGSSEVIWDYKCVEPGDGVFMIHTGVVVNVRRTDIGKGTAWVEYLFIVSFAEQEVRWTN